MDLQKQGSMGFEKNSVSTKSFGLKDKSRIFMWGFRKRFHIYICKYVFNDILHKCMGY